MKILNLHLQHDSATVGAMETPWRHLMGLVFQFKLVSFGEERKKRVKVEGK